MATQLSKSFFVAPILTATPKPWSISLTPSPKMCKPTTFSCGPLHTILNLFATLAGRTHSLTSMPLTPWDAWPCPPPRTHRRTLRQTWYDISGRELEARFTLGAKRRTYLYILLPELLDGFRLGQTNRADLGMRKHHGRDVAVLQLGRLQLRRSKQPVT
jgi:hypothetical protein